MHAVDCACYIIFQESPKPMIMCACLIVYFFAFGPGPLKEREAHEARKELVKCGYNTTTIGPHLLKDRRMYHPHRPRPLAPLGTPSECCFSDRGPYPLSLKVGRDQYQPQSDPNPHCNFSGITLRALSIYTYCTMSFSKPACCRRHRLVVHRVRDPFLPVFVTALLSTFSRYNHRSKMYHLCPLVLFFQKALR